MLASLHLSIHEIHGSSLENVYWFNFSLIFGCNGATSVQTFVLCPWEMVLPIHNERNDSNITGKKNEKEFVHHISLYSASLGYLYETKFLEF